jgi:seryl-tRNA synthetase
MLDPRHLQERRDEIVESCHARHMDGDVDRAIALYERMNALRTELNEANRQRNEHQKAGKRKLSDDEREAHTLEGRRLKESVAALEDGVRSAESEFETCLAQLPNFLHPATPRGHEADWKLIANGEPRHFGFETRTISPSPTISIWSTSKAPRACRDRSSIS